MRMRFRKAQGVTSEDLYEWQVKKSATWYKVYRENILCVEGQYAEKEIVYLAERGKTILLEAFFLKDEKALLIKRMIECID